MLGWTQQKPTARRHARDGRCTSVAAAIPVALIGPPAWVLATLATVAFLLATPGQVGFEAEERGVQILVGIGLLVVGVFILHALGRWLSKREPQAELTAA